MEEKEVPQNPNDVNLTHHRVGSTSPQRNAVLARQKEMGERRRKAANVIQAAQRGKLGRKEAARHKKIVLTR